MVRKGVDMRQHQDKHHADELKVHADEQERRKRDREKGYSPGRKKKNKPGPESPATDHDKSASSSATKGSGLVGWLNPTTPKNQGVGTSDKTRQKGHSNPTKQANITNSFAADSRTQQSKPFFEVADGLARTITSLSSNLSMHIKLWTTDAISRMDDHVAAHQVGLQKVLESIRQSTEELQNVQRVYQKSGAGSIDAEWVAVKPGKKAICIWCTSYFMEYPDNNKRSWKSPWLDVNDGYSIAAERSRITQAISVQQALDILWVLLFTD